MDKIKFKIALEKGACCERLNKAEAYSLVESITPSRLYELNKAALSNRFMRYGDLATYVLNIQINPSNICCSRCSFCGYAVSMDSDYSYVMDEFEIFRKIDQFNPIEIHIVGGLNRIWDYNRNLNLIESLKLRYPYIYIKSFTAVEIAYFAKISGISEKTVLKELKIAGMDAMTGGGAEIFSNRLYSKYWKNKIGPVDWLRIHSLAHHEGIPTNATMLFGIGDNWFERVKHLLVLREAQEQSGGFSCFIPLPFQSGRKKFFNRSPSPLDILTVLAISRLVLNNIPHIKSYWPMIGVATSTAGLSWGADDIDGTISEEKIAHYSGALTPVGMVREKMIETIRLAGFIPKERGGDFN